MMLRKKTNKAIWVGVLIGGIIGLINLYFLGTRFTLVYPIALALKYITDCSGPCWGIITYSMILTLLAWILIGLVISIIIKKVTNKK